MSSTQLNNLSQNDTFYLLEKKIDIKSTIEHSGSSVSAAAKSIIHLRKNKKNVYSKRKMSYFGKLHDKMKMYAVKMVAKYTIQTILF